MYYKIYFYLTLLVVLFLTVMMENPESYRSLEGGFKIPTIGLGTAFLEDAEIVKKAIDSALEIGYRHIDTAFIYNSEQNIGKVLHEWITAKRLERNAIFVTTKLPFQGGHPEAVEPFLKKSLENLQLDYVDLYLIHWPFAFKYEGVDKFNDEPVDADHVAIWKKMEEQVDAGRTKYIGLSNFNISQIENIMKIARIKPVCLQIEMHAYFQNREIVDYCHNNNIVVVAYMPLGSPNFGQVLNDQQKKGIKMQNLFQDETVKRIAEKNKRTVAQILLRFLVQKDVCVIPKSSNSGRLKENFQIFDFKLDNDDMAALEKLDKGAEGRIVNISAIFPKIIGHKDLPF